MSERSGHATIGITLDLYSHVTPSIARDAADVIASRILGHGLRLGPIAFQHDRVRRRRIPVEGNTNDDFDFGEATLLLSG